MKKIIVLSVLLILVMTAIMVNVLVQAATPCNPNASSNAVKVLNYIAGLTNDSSANVIVGQNGGHGNEISDGGGYNNFVENLKNQTGKYVGMVGVDYEFVREYTSAELSSANNSLKNHWNNGGLVTINVTPTNPWGSSVFEKSGADINQLLPNGSKRSVWTGKMDRWATALTDLRNAGVVVLWRPMQEMNGNWFWYAKYNLTDAHTVYASVWQDMYNYYTNSKGLNNLLWVFAPVGDKNFSSYPYPGNSYVDIVAGTGYDDDLNAWGYNDYCSYGKPVGFSEWGPRENSGANANGTFDNNKYIAKIQSSYTKTAYWVTWHSWTNVKMALVDNQNAYSLMNNSNVITRDKINYGGSTVNTPTNTPTQGSIATPTPTPNSGAPAGYTWCANEGSSYTFNTTVDVAYGANGQFNYKYGVTGSITFNNGTFGDPIPGTVKAGYYKNSSGTGATPSPTPTPTPNSGAPAGYTWCANEGSSYTFNTTVDVAYGANGQFNYKYSVTGSITFNNGTFGDPIPGTVKAGYYKNSSGTGATPTPTPTPVTGGGGTNLIANPGFESGNSNWMGSNWSYVAGNQHSGSNAVRIGTGGGSWIAQEVTTNVVAGASYTFSAWNKCDSGQTCDISVQAKNSSGTTIQRFSLAQFNGTSYNQKSTTFTAPSGTVKFYIECWKSSSGGYSYSDDISLVKN